MPTQDANAYGLSWYAATAVASPPRPRLTIETDVDVCVIGGGLAGLTVAREVARRGWSVLVLEAQRIAWNASGRNNGFVLPGFAADEIALVGRVGLEHAKLLWTASEAGAEYVRRSAREMPGVELNEGGWLHVSKTGRAGAMARRHELLNGEFGTPVEMWPAARVREELRSPLYFDALFYPRGFSIHPLNYALGLAAAAEAAGARIHEDTAAVQIDPAGVRKRIATKDARVRAGHVVLAGNVHLDELMPQFSTTLLPVHRYVIATESLGRALRELIRTNAAVSDTELADNHYRVTGGDRLLWSGRSTVWLGRPQSYADALLADIARVYPSLRGIKAEHAWTGTLGHTVHRMPQIGEISPGLWLLSGFGSQGLNTTAMGGEMLARAIVEGDTSWRLFNPFGMVWAGGLFGQVAEQAYTWSFGAREQAENVLARYLKAKRRGRPEPQEPTAAAAVPSKPRYVAPPAAPPPVRPRTEPQPLLPFEPAAIVELPRVARPEILLPGAGIPAQAPPAEPRGRGANKPKKSPPEAPVPEGPSSSGKP